MVHQPPATNGSPQPVTVASFPWIDGLGFPEGLRWASGLLFFSDIVGGTLMCADPTSPRATRLASVPGRPSGLAVRAQDDILIADMVSRCVLHWNGRDIRPVVDLSSIAPRALNDMVLDPDTGNVYVDAYGDDDGRSAIAVVRPDGTWAVATDDVAYPNGLAFLPDSRVLVVAETFRHRLSAFEVLDDGRLLRQGVYAHLRHHKPDGICPDSRGALWVAAYTSQAVLRVEPGGGITHMVTSPAGWVVSCALGDADGALLAVATASTTREAFVRGESAGSLRLATLVGTTGQTDVPAENRH